METRHINYKSDFVVRERFRDASGTFVKLPETDFELRYWVGNHTVTASRKNGEYINCVPDGDAVLVIFKDHGLGEGELKHELHLQLDNAIFPDGVQNVYYPERLRLFLWNGIGDTEGVIESDCLAAYTRGDRFTWGDFTEANIQELQRPAVEAAQAATSAAQSATAAASAANGMAEKASRAATEAAQAADTAAASAKAADSATQSAQVAAIAASEMTAVAKRAVAAAEEVTNKTKQTERRAATAADYATEAGQQAATSAEHLEAMRTTMEQVVERAKAVVQGVPTGLKVEAPEYITLGNDTPQYIRPQVKPDGVAQNVVYQTRGDIVEVEPDGRIVARSTGCGRVQVIPTQGTQHYKTLTIAVVPPRIRLSGDSLRLDNSGNIRLT